MERTAIATAPAITGTAYYVAADGNDAADGLSPATAWKTLAKAAASTGSSTLTPGSAILFRGGDTFTGNEALWISVSGTAGNWITIGSYGTGRATIRRVGTSTSSLINLDGNGYVCVRDIVFDGGGVCQRTGSVGRGSTGTNSNVLILNCAFDNAAETGLFPWVWPADALLANVRISGCSFTGNGKHGLECWASDSAGYAGRDVRQIDNLQVDNCTAYENAEAGIVLSGCANSAITWSIAYNNRNNGMFFYDCTSTFIRFCEAYQNETPNTIDGFGFDVDGGCYLCGIEFCYAHDNEGPGFLFCSYADIGDTTDSYIRNCVSVNNCLNGTLAQGDMDIVGVGRPIINCFVYNNTIIRRDGANTTGAAIRSRRLSSATMNGNRIVNNVVHAGTGQQLVNYANSTGIIFSGNLYSGNQKWNNAGAGVTTLAGWQSREPTALYENRDPAFPAAPTIGFYDAAELSGLFGAPQGSIARTGGTILAPLPVPTYDAFGNTYAAGLIGAGLQRKPEPLPEPAEEPEPEPQDPGAGPEREPEPEPEEPGTDPVVEQPQVEPDPEPQPDPDPLPELPPAEPEPIEEPEPVEEPEPEPDTPDEPEPPTQGAVTGGPYTIIANSLPVLTGAITAIAYGIKFTGNPQ